jgi:PAS domain S-box-containing protein
MGAPRGSKAEPALVPDRTRSGGQAAAVLDFAVAQILPDDTALGALPAVLERLVAAFGIRAALAFQASAGQPATVLAVHPPGAAGPALLAKLGAMSLAQRGSPVPLTLESGEGAGSGATGSASALLAYSVPVDGQCLCALALIGDAASWNEEARVTAHTVAAMVATQIRHANDLAQLVERQALTQALIAAAPVAILAMDSRSRVIEFNPAAEKLSGFRRDDVLGQELADFLVTESFKPRFREHIRTYVETGDPEEFTGAMRMAIRHADGTERMVELTPVQLTLGGAPVFTGFLRDLTEVERSHAALADQTERLNCMIATAIPGVLITDENGLVTNVSQSFGTMFGLGEPSRLLGASAASVLQSIQGLFADPDDFLRRVTEASRARQPVSGEQAPCTDGRTLECDYWPLVVNGRYRGDLWFTWDMSERKVLEEQRQQMLEAELAARRLAEQAQRQLEEQNERLRIIDENRNQFLAIVSHEMRTPLTSIVSFTELIRGEAEGLTPEGVRFLGIIERNADRLHRLIGDLLMLDRLEAGALPLELADMLPADLVNEAVRTAAPTAAKQGVTLTVDATPGPAVPGDARRLMQVLDNLIANAVKFSHRDGRVHVTASCAAGTWRIDVADSGIGIPAEEADQLFTRFVRASNARTAGLPGTGLGLSIVKVLTEMHGGRVEVRSTLGRGSMFSVFLPVVPPRAAPDQAAP